MSQAEQLALADDLGVADTGSTGHEAVDAALETVAEAAPLPPADQIGAFEGLHRTLQQTLATIEQV